MSAYPSDGSVLVVSGSRARAESICRRLEACSLPGIGAAGERDAVRALIRYPVQAALVHVDVGPSWQLDALIRRVRELRDIGVVLLSSGRGTDVLVDAFRLGAVDCVLDSSDTADIADAVSRAMAWSRQTRVEDDPTLAHVLPALDRRRDRIVAVLSGVTTVDALHRQLDELYGTQVARLHSIRRIASAAAVISDVLHLPESTRQTLDQAALLHDLGGLVLADLVLDRERPCTAPEMMLLRARAGWTVATLDRVGWLAPAARAVDAMREHFDGSGMPRGLCGDEIPIAGRVLAVACAVESLSAAWPVDREEAFTRANAALVQGAGRLFDPHVVNAWLRALDRFGPNLREVS